jgi:hypothetical protein
MAQVPGSARIREKAAQQSRKHQALDSLFGLPAAEGPESNRREAQHKEELSNS